MIHYFRGGPLPTTQKLTYSETLRSHSVHFNLNHCIELKYESGSGAFEVGFSPTSNTREFISLLGDSIYNETTVFQWHSGHDYNLKVIDYVHLGEVFMLCGNSERHEFIVKRGSVITNQSFIEYEEVKEWYVSLDAGKKATENNPSIIELNLGTTAFVHSLPDGYNPWASEVDEYRDLPRQPTCLNHTIHYIILIFIYVLK